MWSLKRERPGVLSETRPTLNSAYLGSDAGDQQPGETAGVEGPDADVLKT